MPIPTELLASITDQLSPGGEPGTAEDAAQVWRRLFAQFRPLLGPLSTDLLFTRTLFKHGKDLPWLQEAAASQPGEAFALFLRQLQERPPGEVVALNRALVATYATELAGLIGDRLAGRFLHAAFTPGAAHENT